MHASLAREAIAKYIETGKILPVPSGLPPEFYEKKHGVFVSLQKGKELRGCIGTYQPSHENLAEEIILNAIAACSRDPRFPALVAQELSDIAIEVSVLSEPEKIANMSELDPRRYGIIVKCPDGRMGLLLPGLPGIDETGQQLSLVCQKGAINPAVDKDMEILRFEVEKYSS